MNTVCNIKGKVFDIQRFCVHDGPGIRTTVFLKGCPLHCAWCHNPESWSYDTELLYSPSVCIGCGECVKVCKSVAQILSSGVHSIDRAHCIGCMACTNICPTEALSASGEEKSVDEVLQSVLRDKDFYKEDGGMTVSGGEPFMQPDFLLELLKTAKSQGIHTAVETSGAARTEDLLNAIPYTDLFLYDCKMIPGEAHKKHIGVDGKQLHEKLLMLDRGGAAIIMRCPILPQINDTAEHFSYIATLANSMKNLRAIHIEPYHTSGISKFASLGKEAAFCFPDFDAAAFRKKLQEYIPALKNAVSVPVELL